MSRDHTRSSAEQTRQRNAARKAKAIELGKQGYSAAQVAKLMGGKETRNSVLGLWHRSNFTPPNTRADGRTFRAGKAGGEANSFTPRAPSAAALRLAAFDPVVARAVEQARAEGFL